MTIRRTWWVKLRRAEKHLREFNQYFLWLRDTEQPYSVSCEIKSSDNVDYLIVRGYLPPLPVDGDDIAAIIGDLIANTRSALDHICVALTGHDHAQFPIFMEDVWQPNIDPATGKDRNKAGRDRFTKMTHGTPAAALTIVKSVQPYAASPQDPELNALALLNRISNADKHRTLLVMSSDMHNAKATVSVPGFVKPTVITEPRRERGDGAILGSMPVSWPPDTTPEVDASGGIIIRLQEAPPHQRAWVVPRTLEVIVEHVRANVIRPLDGLVT
jgi:hypothetical protein